MSEEEIKEIIDKIKQEEFPYALAIAKAYEKLEEENKKLKENYNKLLKENFKLKQHPILTEFEKWLEEKIKCTEQYADNDMAKGYINAMKLCKYYLQELKEGKK